ncbi:hypothetical protein BC826DRAFT_1177021 [Russula brevipes]|nr:hypothetical protein BC826DRAFT_1177021 [Russula brevipes]
MCPCGQFVTEGTAPHRTDLGGVMAISLPGRLAIFLWDRCNRVSHLVQSSVNVLTIGVRGCAIVVTDGVIIDDSFLPDAGADTQGSGALAQADILWHAPHLGKDRARDEFPQGNVPTARQGQLLASKRCQHHGSVDSGGSPSSVSSRLYGFIASGRNKKTFFARRALHIGDSWPRCAPFILVPQGLDAFGRTIPTGVIPLQFRNFSARERWEGKISQCGGYTNFFS